MINGFKIITLCGSTRFKEEFLEAQKRLTLEGNIVISVGLFGHSGDDVVWTEGVKDMLDRQHLAKIDLADEIFVINVGGYIGDSTRREIITTLHLANFIKQEGSLMMITNKQIVTLTKSVMLPLQNTMHVKALGPINGKTSMLLFVEYCSNLALLL